MGLSTHECGLILDNADVRPRRDRTRLPPGFPGELLKLAPFPAAAKRTTRRSRYVTFSHDVSLEAAGPPLEVIHSVGLSSGNKQWTCSFIPARRPNLTTDHVDRVRVVTTRSS